MASRELVVVEWMDAYLESDWVSGGDWKPDRNEMTTKTVGWVVYRDEDMISVAQTVQGASEPGGQAPDDLGAIWTIPAPWVISIAHVDVRAESPPRESPLSGQRLSLPALGSSPLGTAPPQGCSS